MKPPHWRAADSKARSGQVLVVAAFAILVLGIIAALAVDIGYVCCARAQLQNAADAATLAATQELVAQRNDGSGEATARSVATDEAEALVAANWGAAGWHITFGTFEEGTFVEQPVGVDATSIKVTAERNEDAPGGSLALFFARLAGINSVDVTAAGVCSLSTDIQTIRNSNILMPFAVYKGDVLAPGETMVIYDLGQVAPGNFGLLDFNGGSNPMWEICEWIRNGYDGEVTIDPDTSCTWIDGEPGFRAAMESTVEERLGDTLIVCVYDDVTDQGANCEYRIVQFLGVTLTECSLRGQEKYIKARVEELVNVPDGEPGGSGGNLCLIKLVQ